MYRWASGDLKLLTSEWRALSRPGEMECLISAGILTRCEEPSEYLCGLGTPGCRRKLLAKPGRPEAPWRGLCSQHPWACSPVDLTEADVEQYAWNHDAFVREVSRALGVSGPVVEREYLCLELGTLVRGRHSYQVILAFCGHLTVRALLAERLGAGRRTLVVVPTRLGIGPELEERYGRAMTVVLGFLDDLMEERAGSLEMGKGLDDLLAPREEPDEDPQHTHVWLHDNNGLREITEEQADDIAKRRSEYDFFVDAMHADIHGNYAVGRRELDGRPVCAPVSSAVANGLAELVVRGGPVAVEQLAGFRTMLDPVAAIQRARREIDIKVGGCWRSIVSVPGQRDGLHWYVFKRDADVLVAVLFKAAKGPMA